MKRWMSGLLDKKMIAKKAMKAVTKATTTCRMLL